MSNDFTGQPFSAIPVFFLSLGTQVCHLKSIGEGPVIYVHPIQVDFGNIYVLKDSSRTLNLSNQSFIPALFRAHMVSKLWDCWVMKTVFYRQWPHFCKRPLKVITRGRDLHGSTALNFILIPNSSL